MSLVLESDAFHELEEVELRFAGLVTGLGALVDDDAELGACSWATRGCTVAGVARRDGRVARCSSRQNCCTV